jgi:4'-phosphopantetheinyl transferase
MVLTSSSWINTVSLQNLSQECFNGEVHVWYLNLKELCSTHLGFYHNLLSQDEKERAQKFYFQTDRDRFIGTRGVLRYLLSNYLESVGASPVNLVFQYNAYGKPLLAAPFDGSEIHFNVTHSGNIALCAFSRTHPIGIDVEFIREDIGWKELADQFFSKQESSKIQSIAPHYQTVAFYSCWTRKEALLKGLGLGLSIPLNQFEVSVSPDELEVQPVDRSDSSQFQDWTIWNLPVLDHYASALATQGSPRTIQSFKFPFSRFREEESLDIG